MILAIAALALGSGWSPLPLRTVADRRAGRVGGEGGQVVLGLAASSDGRFLLMGIDVAGIYRSRDGGNSWGLATVGYWPRGASAVAIDPNNPRRCLAIGANSTPNDFHGPWLSSDGASSWRPSSLKAKIAGHQDSRDQIAYMPSSFDGERTRTVFWSRPRNDSAGWGAPEIHPAIYRSDDGGESWRELPGTGPMAGGIVRCHPRRKGVVYATGSGGLFASRDSGDHWALLRAGIFEGFDVSAAQPDALYLNTASELVKSLDAGKTWTVALLEGVAAEGYVAKNLHLNPLDPRQMVLWRDQQPNHWDWRRYASGDGGRTWTQAEFDSAAAFLPYNVRGAPFAWTSTPKAQLWSVGGDWPTASADGGRSYSYAGAGENAILVGGMWNFSLSDPDVVFFGSQDYNGAISTDAGETWRYTNVSGNRWGGFVYGGYAVTRNFLIAGNADGWGGKRILRVSNDGGGSWRDTGIALDGPDVSFGCPDDPRIAFAKNYRTADAGATWQKMDGCAGVYASAGRNSLLGVRGRTVVQSADRGVHWNAVADAPDDIRDLAYDPRRKRVYAVIGDRAAWWSDTWHWLDLPKNQFGGTNARSVAVDPVNPAVVYVGSAANVFSTTAAVVRSVDAGQSWTNLTRATPLGSTDRDGGREALCIRVHPRTRELWVSTSCYGIWKWTP